MIKSKDDFVNALKDHPLLKEASTMCKTEDELKALLLFIEDIGGSMGIILAEAYVQSQNDPEFVDEVKNEFESSDL